MNHPTKKATITVPVPEADRRGHYHWLYLTTEPATGDFYIGKHSSFFTTTGYMGSGAWVSKKSPYELETQIISYHASTEAAHAAEVEMIAAMREGCTAAQCRNIARGAEGGAPTFEQLQERARRIWVTRKANREARKLLNASAA